MPRLMSEPLFAADGLTLRRVTCDGVDSGRAADEQSERARLILVLQGRFAFQDTRTRAIASPITALYLEDDHRYRIRHLDGGDVCLALEGDVCRELLASGPTTRSISTGAYIVVRSLAAELGGGRMVERFAVEEALTRALAPARTRDLSSSREKNRELAAAITYRLERDVDARLSLRKLIEGTGASLFHACRIFRRQTGFSIHRFHQEVRLRHALALLLDTARPVADIAVEVGFANQAHLTNLFRRRFHTTPARARKTGLPNPHRTPRISGCSRFPTP